MISLRRSVLLCAASALVTFAASCGDAVTAPTAARTAATDGGARTTKTTDPVFPTAVGTVSSSANSSAIVDARILLFKSGAAVVQFNTGAFSNTTNSGTANGHFTSLTYTVYDGTKVLTTRTITTNKSSGVFAEQVNLCTASSSKDDDDGDDDDDDGHSSCTAQYLTRYTTVVNATITGVSNDSKKSYTLSLLASELNAPDIDLTNVPISIVGGASSTTQLNAVTNTATTYSVDFANTKPIVVGTTQVPPTVGLQTTCIVTVNGTPQIPYFNTTGFAYVGSATPFVAAQQTQSCKFSLNLPAGSYTIAVTALPGAPGDYDPSNNTTTVKLMVADAGTGGSGGGASLPVVTFGVPSLKVTNGTTANQTAVPGGSITYTAGTRPTFEAAITVASNPVASVAQATCSVKITNGATTLATIAGSLNVPITFDASGAATSPPKCTFAIPSTVTIPTTGTTTVAVTISDPTPTVYTATSVTSSFVIVPVAEADLGALRITDLGATDPTAAVTAEVVALNTTNTYRLVFTNRELPGAASATATCAIISVKDANGADIPASAYTAKLVTPQPVAVASQANGNCDFQFTIAAGGVFNVTVGYVPGQTDPITVNDPSSLTLSLTSALAFDLSAVSAKAQEDWTFTPGLIDTAKVTDQSASVTQLSMLLIPSQPNIPLGTFSLEYLVRTGAKPGVAGASNGFVTVARGVVPVAPLMPGTSTTPSSCTGDVVNADASVMPSNVGPGGLVLAEAGAPYVCAITSTKAGFQNYQQIVVSGGVGKGAQICVGSTTGPCGASATPPYLFTAPNAAVGVNPRVCFEFRLTYQLTGSTAAAAVSVASVTFDLDAPVFGDNRQLVGMSHSSAGTAGLSACQ